MDLDLEKAGVRLNELGFIQTDEYQNTTYVFFNTCIVISIVQRTWHLLSG